MSKPRISDLKKRILALKNSGKSICVIAIDGKSGAGKSTLARALARALDAALIDGDDFYCGGCEVRLEPAEQLVSCCIDWARQKTVLQQLACQETARYFPFDWEKFDGALSKIPRLIRPKEFVILEGVYSARPELAPYLDIKILLDAPRDIRERRLTEREGKITDWERQWHRTEDWYFAHVIDFDEFDIVIDNG